MKKNVKYWLVLEGLFVVYSVVYLMCFEFESEDYRYREKRLTDLIKTNNFGGCYEDILVIPIGAGERTWVLSIWITYCGNPPIGSKVVEGIFSPCHWLYRRVYDLSPYVRREFYGNGGTLTLGSKEIPYVEYTRNSAN